MGGSVGRAPTCRAGDLGSNPGPGKNFFSLKLAKIIIDNKNIDTVQKFKYLSSITNNFERCQE